MKNLRQASLLLAALLSVFGQCTKGFTSLFDGKTLNGWKQKQGLQTTAWKMA